MKILAHLDPVVLESVLLDELVESRSQKEPTAALVIVPTHRLAGHLEQRLLERQPAWLGLEVLHFRALAQRILEEAGEPGLRLLSPRLIEALLRRVLRRQPENRWSAFVKERPGALGPLGVSLNDLREAGLSPDDVTSGVGEDAPGRDLAGLFAAMHEEFDRVRQANWVDDAGLMRAAIPHAAAFAARRHGLWLHGAYELIGVHARLLDALDQGREARVLLPYRAGAPVSRFAERFLADREAQVEEISSVDKRPALEALYDEDARPTPSEQPQISYRSTQGAAAEIKGAVRAALAAVHAGCPPSEIVIAARSLAPYQAAIDEVFEQENLPWTGSLAQALRNHPAIHDLALLVAVLDENFPRRGTAELLRSPRVRWDRFMKDGEAARVAMADGWSRAAGIVGGLDEWREGLVEWAGRTYRRDASSKEDMDRTSRLATERTEEARKIARLLER
ncbi:MAG: PD-(D/E)XK nuclease family protein, partial [Planctomycetota bacterium]